MDFSGSTLIEFDVNLSCETCVSSVKKALSLEPEIKNVKINLEKQSVIVGTTLPSQSVKRIIESTGKRAVLKGFGVDSFGSAVAEFKSDGGIVGVIRFFQKRNNLCIIDGTIDGLKPGEHGLHIHEFGDLSEGYNSIGPHYNPDNKIHGGHLDKERHYGDLGNIYADKYGRASFVHEDNIVKVGDIIGRSIAVTTDRDDLGIGSNEASKLSGNSGKILTCAIIARSSGLFQNPKRICQCDGISIWDEKNSPASSKKISKAGSVQPITN